MSDEPKMVTDLIETAPCGCYECGSRDAPFLDSRTGANYCHECLYCFLGWELDGCPTDTAISEGYVVEVTNEPGR